MGHRCAPEVMHTITATIAGDPEFCLEREAFAGRFKADVYVDGLRYAGTKEQVVQYIDFIEDRAQRVGATFKDSGAEPMKNYVINGVFYCHEGKVKMGPKIVKKMARDTFRYTTYAKLESAVGRLIHASAVLGEPIPDYYFPFKGCKT